MTVQESWSHQRRIARILRLTFLLLVPASSLKAQAPPRYRLTDLGSLTGAGGYSYARAINDKGQITGQAGAPNSKNHAFLWTPGGTKGVLGNAQMEDLGSPSSQDSFGNGINDSGVVVGSYVTEDFHNHAFYYNGAFNDMGTTGGGTDSEARGINSAGQIVGTFTDKNYINNAFVWFGSYTDVKSLLGKPNNGEGFGYAQAIADNGQIAANGYDNDAFGAFLVNFNNPANVLDWGGAAGNGLVNIHNIGQVEAVNAFGNCAGKSYDVNASSTHAVLFALVSLPSDPRYLYDLGTLSKDNIGGPHDYSKAYGINDSSDVVGYSATLGYYGHAFLWQRNGDQVMHDLNDLIDPNSGWRLHTARDINNRGEIVGDGDAPDGSSRAFLLTPVKQNASLRFDFNGDGHADLLFQSQSDGSVPYETMNGVTPGSFGYLFPGVALDLKLVATPDLNGDGKPDVLFQSQSTGLIAYGVMNGLAPTGQYGYLFPSPLPAGYRVAATPDLNGDGSPDIRFQNQATGDIAYTFLKGLTPGASDYLFRGLDPNLKLVGTPDLNGDGHPDLLFENLKTGDVLYALMKGTAPISYGTLFRNVPLEYQIVGTPDLNADGFEDIVFQGQTNGDVSYALLNNLSVTGYGYLFYGVNTDYKIVGVH